ncbi:MAG TPA: efflux RND transporter periplasmic adaptor subunit [Candidatus Omnitrophota bacterium]|nr:efflux RND transporter periplasmic adaptor subunit [Candidatus Omnitrophota bacterium]HPN88103.1 efflux RND transporter periplasmic adaptor subunit [Candidatus Omnitrophota bacterium]
MRSKGSKLFIVGIVIIFILGFFYLKIQGSKKDNSFLKEIKPLRGSIENIISTTGTILPKNRLEVKPPVSGRVENILVKEGQKVKAGETLAWMSSTERAALLDAARGEGDEALKYWTDIYKAIPLISPIDGEVIVAKTQPGQTVTVNDAVIVLSDELIIRAQVDETDIGKIKIGQKAVISLDAYADEKVKATAEHIYYESETVNNVTVYKVDLVPERIPVFFRSGMNTTIDFIENSKENALLVPMDAVTHEKDGAYVLVKKENSAQVVSRPVVIGIMDEKNVEILAGIEDKDIVVIKINQYELPKSDVGKNPFMPDRRQNRQNRSK